MLQKNSELRIPEQAAIRSIILPEIVFLYTLILSFLISCYMRLAWHCLHPLLSFLVCVFIYNTICLELIPSYHRRRHRNARLPTEEESARIHPYIDEILYRARLHRKIRVFMADRKEQSSFDAGQRTIIVYTGLLKKCSDEQVRVSIAASVGSLITGHLNIRFYCMAAGKIHLEIYRRFCGFFNWKQFSWVNRVLRTFVLAIFVLLLLWLRWYAILLLSPLLLLAFCYLQYLNVILSAFIERKQIFALDRLMYLTGYGDQLIKKMKAEEFAATEKIAAFDAESAIVFIRTDPAVWTRMYPTLKERIRQLEQLAL